MSIGGSSAYTPLLGSPVYINSKKRLVDQNNFPIDDSLISVTDYGAVGNGETDDTLAVLTALNGLRSAGGGTLYFPPGNYVVSAVLFADAQGVSLRGDGWTSKITRKGDCPTNIGNCITFVNCQGFTVSGINFVSNNKIITTLYLDNLIGLTNCTDWTISDCYFSIGYAAAVLTIGSSRGRITRNSVYAQAENPASPNVNATWGAFYIIDGSSRIGVTDNDVETCCVGVALQNVNPASPEISECVVANNRIRNCSTYGILAYTIGPIGKIIIANNTVDTVYGSKTNVATGGKTYGSGIYVQTAQRCVVSGNYVSNVNIQTDDQTLAPAAITATGMQSIAITGNVINTAPITGIGVSNATSLFDVTSGASTVTGNQIYSAAGGTGIYLLDRKFVSVTGNTVTGFNYGIRTAVANTASCSGITICGNNLNYPVIGGIVLESTTGFNISANYITFTNTAAGTGIALGVSSSVLNGMVVGNFVAAGLIAYRCFATSTANVIANNNLISSPTGYQIDGFQLQVDTNSNSGIPGTTLYAGAWSPFRTSVVSGTSLDSRGLRYARVDGTSGPTITVIAYGLPGQLVTIYNSAPAAGNITLVYDATTLQLAGSVDLVLTPGSDVTLLCTGTVAPVLWQEVSRKMA